MRKNSRRTSRRKKGSTIAFFCFLALFVFSTFMVLKDFIERKEAANSYSELQFLVKQAEYEAATATNAGVNHAEISESSENEPTTVNEDYSTADVRQKNSMDFSELKAINPDIIGWLRAEGTNIDYPVAQTDDNEFYLSHLYNGEWNNSGTIFADFRNAGDFSDKNTVIYGHHMKNGSMFASLEEYKDPEFYSVNPTMTLFTPVGDYRIELICGTVEDGDYQFVEFSFDSGDDFMKYVDSFRARSTFFSDIELQPEDRIISLCTCTYERANARFMVIGRMVPIMENVEITS